MEVMFEYGFLQQYWWFIVSLLGGLLVFLMFVQGGNAMIFSAGKNERQRQMIVNSTGRKWEFTFTTLVTFGGAFFASFPLFYSTSFGGAFWVWVLILITFVFQAVSYEFQTKAGNLLGKNAFRIFLTVNGCLAPLLIGTAVGTFFTGSDFTVNKEAVGDSLAPVISVWGSGWHGLEAVTDFRNLLLGLAVMFLSATLGCLYMINNIDDRELVSNIRKNLPWAAGGFVLFFVAFMTAIFLSEGYADIVKVGSPLGFVLSENKIEVLESDSLPLGILDGVKPTTMRKKLSDGDALLFISDGVTDAFGSSADIADFLASLSPRNPQALCDSLITEALARSGGAKDDMTAVAARLFLSSENESAE